MQSLQGQEAMSPRLCRSEPQPRGLGSPCARSPFTLSRAQAQPLSQGTPQPAACHLPPPGVGPLCGTGSWGLYPDQEGTEKASPLGASPPTRTCILSPNLGPRTTPPPGKPSGHLPPWCPHRRHPSLLAMPDHAGHTGHICLATAGTTCLVLSLPRGFVGHADTQEGPGEWAKVFSWGC